MTKFNIRDKDAAKKAQELYDQQEAQREAQAAAAAQVEA